MDKAELISKIIPSLTDAVQIDNGEWAIPGEIVDGVQQYLSVKIGTKGTKKNPFNIDTAVANYKVKAENALARASKSSTKVDPSIISEANMAMQDTIYNVLHDADGPMTAQEILEVTEWNSVSTQKVARLCAGLVNSSRIERTEKDKKVAYQIL